MPTISPGSNTSSPFASWKVDHAGVRVEDIDTAITWYVETLERRLHIGFQIRGAARDEPVSIRFFTDRTTGNG